MKNKRSEQCAHHIREALNYLGEDFAMLDIRDHLQRALSGLNRVQEKRTKRTIQTIKFQEEAKRKSQDWWETLQQGLQEAIKKDQEKPESPSL